MYEPTEQERKELDFFLKAHEEIKDFGVVYNYVCPRCGGTVIAYKEVEDRHLQMKCDNCKFLFME
jgi:hypothetical protein